MKIFLDDVRVPKECLSYMYHRIGALNPIYLEEWVTVRNYYQFVSIVQNNLDHITHISFDHDLADLLLDEERNEMTEKTGYDCAVWLKDYYKNYNRQRPQMFVHSMNPVGTEKIIKLFNPNTL